MSDLTGVVRELEQHAAQAGWDQPAQLFALVSTAELVAREPGLAEVLDLAIEEPDIAGVVRRIYSASR